MDSVSDLSNKLPSKHLVFTPPSRLIRGRVAFGRLSFKSRPVQVAVVFSRGSGISRSYPAHVRHQVSFGLVSVCVKGCVDSVGEVRTKHIDACIMRFGYTYEYVALSVQYLLGWTTRDEITSRYLTAEEAG